MRPGGLLGLPGDLPVATHHGRLQRPDKCHRLRRPFPHVIHHRDRRLSQPGPGLTRRFPGLGHDLRERRFLRHDGDVLDPDGNHRPEVRQGAVRAREVVGEPGRSSIPGSGLQLLGRNVRQRQPALLRHARHRWPPVSDPGRCRHPDGQRRASRRRMPVAVTGQSSPRLQETPSGGDRLLAAFCPRPAHHDRTPVGRDADR